jgi:hypothetical protein
MYLKEIEIVVDNNKNTGLLSEQGMFRAKIKTDEAQDTE